jgi:predicted DCC family thiol-disulfide oxidoreductase YuxK
VRACDLEVGRPAPEVTGGDPGGTRPLLIWDGDCGLCQRSALHLRALTGERIAFEPYQSARNRFPDVPEESFQHAVHLWEPGGRISRGAEAVFRALERGGVRPWWRVAYDRIPGFAALAEWGYSVVAGHRGTVARWLQLLTGNRIGPTRYRSTRWLFLRALGVVFLVAFASLGVQLGGLAGEGGLLPSCAYLDRVEAALGSERFWRAPTLLWLGCGDDGLRLLVGSGLVSAALLTLGAAQGPALIVCFASYLSLFHAIPTFLGFQWDVLLLETAFLSLFLTPWSLAPRLPRAEPAPSVSGIWLLRLLMLKLMVSSGVTKLTWNDPTWRDLTALSYHYWTQPLPAAGAWLAHRLPLWVHQVSCAVMYAIEIGLPFLGFGPRRLRLVAFGGLALLQLAIAATGHYGFFNLLTLVLCLPLLDDDLLPAPLRRLAEPEPPPPATGWRGVPRVILAAGIAALCIVPLSSAFLPGFWRERPDHPLLRLRDATRPFALSSEYGLFRVMTTTRPELELQGRIERGEWRPYAFRYKPGDVGRPPPWAQPHMPRLDWQMWFAALHAERAIAYGSSGLEYWLQRQDPWLPALARGLLHRESAIEGLLGSDPFPDSPPTEIRVVLWQYRFAPASRPEWWTRERVAVVGSWTRSDGP